MNAPLRNLPRLLALALLPVFSATPAAAENQPGALPSPHFEAVSKHLDSGSTFFSYIDLDGDAARLASGADAMLEVARQEMPGVMPDGLKASGVIKSLGLDRLKAIGLSSLRTSATGFINRAILLLPEGRTGLFNLLGGEPTPWVSPALAPADSDFVIESDITLGAVLPLIESLLESTGEAHLTEQYKSLLGFPVPGFNLTANDLIAKLNTRLLLSARVEKDKTFSPPGQPATFPVVHVVIALDQLDFLFPPLKTYAAATGQTEFESGDGFELIRLPRALPGDLAFFQPVLYHDLKSKRLLLSTHPADVRWFLAEAPKLAINPAFIQATAGLPKDGNHFSYLTPAAGLAMENLSESLLLARSSPDGGPDPALVRGFLEKARQLFPPSDQPLVSTRANRPEGIVFQSSANHSYKATLTLQTAFTAGLVTGVVKGIRDGIRQAAQSAENDQKPSPPRARPRPRPQPAPPGQDDEETDQATSARIRNNLQQITFAAQAWFLDNPDEAEVSFDQLIKAELLFRPEPVAGESYQKLTLKRTGGTLSVTLKSGGSLSRDYGPVAK
ncbi:MAG: hypothetical protein JWL81_1859 [Verrucomicrobiales bacterium]|nr:hypothetical protein [Verrucomicrobiales bacterium]